MEIIGGMDIDIKRGKTGFVPMTFSLGSINIIISLPTKKETMIPCLNQKQKNL